MFTLNFVWPPTKTKDRHRKGDIACYSNIINIVLTVKVEFDIVALLNISCEYVPEGIVKNA